MSVFFEGMLAAEVFNKLTVVLEKLELVTYMEAHMNAPMTFASEDAHLMDVYTIDDLPYAVEVVASGRSHWYE